MVSEFKAVEATITRLPSLYPEQVLENLIYIEELSYEQLSDESQVQRWCDLLSEALNVDQRSGSFRYTIEHEKDNEPVPGRLRAWLAPPE